MPCLALWRLWVCFCEWAIHFIWIQYPSDLSFYALHIQYYWIFFEYWWVVLTNHQVHPCGEQHSMIAPVQEGLVDVEPCKKLPLKTPTDIQKCPVGRLVVSFFWNMSFLRSTCDPHRCCVTCGDLDNLSNLVRCTICDGWACPEDSCSWVCCLLFVSYQWKYDSANAPPPPNVTLQNHKCRKCLNEHKDRPSSPKASTNSEVTNTESITVQKQPG